eukprot:3848409-Pleurochrysis_carterae.AAC.1
MLQRVQCYATIRTLRMTQCLLHGVINGSFSQLEIPPAGCSYRWQFQRGSCAPTGRNAKHFGLQEYSSTKGGECMQRMSCHISFYAFIQVPANDLALLALSHEADPDPSLRSAVVNAYHDMTHVQIDELAGFDCRDMHMSDDR